MKKVFLVSLMPYWLGVTRLPKALKDEGFTVITLTHEYSFLAKSMFIDQLYTYKTLTEFRNLILKIVAENEIDLLIPGCDKTVSYFSEIALNKSWSLINLNVLRNLIIKSSNNKDAYYLLGNKSVLQEMAQKHNVPTPRNMVLNTEQEVLNELKNRTFPVVLKKDFGAAGDGVRICKNIDEVKVGYKELNSKLFTASKLYSVKKFFYKLLALPYDIKNKGVSVQDYIDGTPCIYDVLASKGEVLTSIALLKIKSYPNNTSPSCVVKAINHEQISEGCAKIIKELNVSGFLNFDFMVDQSNNAYLLECNPRPTQATHFSALCGGNLCAMLKKHLDVDGSNNIQPYPNRKYEYIALFPNELKRDRNSEYIQNGYHDVPFADVKLFEVLCQELKELDIPIPIAKNEIS